MCQDQKASLKKEWKPSNDMRNNYRLGTAGTTDTVLGTSLHFPAPSTQALRPLWIHTLTITAEVISPPEVTRKPRLRKKKRHLSKGAQLVNGWDRTQTTHLYPKSMSFPLFLCPYKEQRGMLSFVWTHSFRDVTTQFLILRIHTKWRT